MNTRRYFRKLIAFILSFVLICTMLPQVPAAEEPTDFWSLIENYEQRHISSQRGSSAEADDYAAISGEIANLVMSDAYYKEGTCTYDADSGNSFFFWEDESGEVYGYSPRLRAQLARTAIKDADPEEYAAIDTVSFSSKGTFPGSANVAVFQPYYGIDYSFSTKYKNEGLNIASTTGGSSTTYLTTAATVDNIASALQSCGVVIIDSHGDTDFFRANNDYVSGAHSSYICLQTNTGLTTADMAVVTGQANNGTVGTYYHAYNGGSSGSIRFYCVDGTVLANHMTANTSTIPMIWMAICLGMATKGLYEPLRNKGVSVVYGYSQSVSFKGDYEYEEYFWELMRTGATIATAAAYMKSESNSNWDPAYKAFTFNEARRDCRAFPWFISDEDSYPSTIDDPAFAYRLTDQIQTVNSTWTLFETFNVSAISNNDAWGSVSVNGSTISAFPASGYYVSGWNIISGSASCSLLGNIISVSPTSDCCIEVVFSPKPTVTLTFIADGETCMTETVYKDEETFLPGYTSNVDGFVFEGWVADQQEETTTRPTVLASCTPSEDSTFYALFRRHESVQSTNGDYRKINYEPASWVGEYVLVYEESPRVLDCTLPKLDVTDNYQPITIRDNTISASDGDTYKITIEAAGDWYTLKTVTGNYFGINYDINGFGCSETNAYLNTISYTGNAADITSYGGSHLRYNKISDMNRFRYYKSSSYASHQPVQLYKKNGISYIYFYTTNPVMPTPCQHEDFYEDIIPPTCTEDGIINVYCSECGELLCTVTSPALGHDWTVAATFPATCTEAGHEDYNCSRCDAAKTEAIPSSGHLLVYHSAKSATCTDVGWNEYQTCSKCSYSTYSEIPPLGHNYVSHTAKAATCTEIGWNAYQTCTRCDSTDYSELPALGHDMITDYPYQPTCTSYGLTEGSHCSRCEYAIAQQTLQPLGHAYIYTDNADYETHTITCSRCEYHAVENHIFVNGTCCCGANEITKPIMLEIPVNHSIDLAEDISVMFAVQKTFVSAYEPESMYLDYNYNLYSGNAIAQTVSGTLYADGSKNPNYWFFTLTGITAVEMGTEISAQLHLFKHGIEFVVSDTYSVAAYAYNQLNKSTSDTATKTVCANLLRYGAAAQTYKNVRTDALPDAAMTDAQRAYLTDLEDVFLTNHNTLLSDLDSPSVVWVGRTFEMNTRVELKFVFSLAGYTGNIDDIHLSVNYTDYTGEPKTYDVPNSRLCVYNESRNYYSFNIDCMRSADMRTVFQVAVFEGQTQVSQTSCYSVESYGYNKTGDILTLCKALVAYSDACAEKFAR